MALALFVFTNKNKRLRELISNLQKGRLVHGLPYIIVERTFTIADGRHGTFYHFHTLEGK